MMIIAHRGASGYAPENTIEAFQKAIDMGCSAFELDVHRSKDGVLIVRHDYCLEEKDGTKIRINYLNYKEIKNINVAGKAGFAFVPKFEDVLMLLKGKADFINVEIKNDRNIYPDIEEQVLRITNGLKIAEKTVFSSFHFPSLVKLRNKSLNLRLAFLGDKLTNLFLLPAIRKAKSVNCENFHINKKNAFRFNIKLLKRVGFKVCVYTVNETRQAKKFKDIGVDGIFSDYPDILDREI